MNLTTIITLAAGLLGGGTIGILYKTWKESAKVAAEARNINISGELSISQAAIEYSNTLRSDLEAVKKELKDLQERFTTMQAENIKLRTQVDLLTRENINLRKRLDDKHI